MPGASNRVAVFHHSQACMRKQWQHAAKGKRSQGQGSACKCACGPRGSKFCVVPDALQAFVGLWRGIAARGVACWLRL